MNEITKTPFNNIAPYDADVDLDALREFVSQSATPAMPGEWVRFRKGDYLFGQDERKASVTEAFIANTGEILVGWLKLEDGTVTERIGGRVADRFRAPARESLGDEESIGTPGDPWKPLTAMVVRDANLNIFCFTSITTSGRQAVMDLLGQYLRRCRQQPGKLPAVLFGVGTGRSKKHNTTYPVPKFTIVGWEPWDPEVAAYNPASAGAKSDLTSNVPREGAAPVNSEGGGNDDGLWDESVPPANPEDFRL
jgi:hypothetical protein